MKILTSHITKKSVFYVKHTCAYRKTIQWINEHKIWAHSYFAEKDTQMIYEYIKNVHVVGNEGNANEQHNMKPSIRLAKI